MENLVAAACLTSARPSMYTHACSDDGCPTQSVAASIDDEYPVRERKSATCCTTKARSA